MYFMKIFTLALACSAAIFGFAFAPKTTTQVYDLKYIEKNLCFITNTKLKKAERELVGVKQNDFYLFNQEITNGFYLFYVKQVKNASGMEAYKKALPDTLVWRHHNAYNEAYVEYYLRHPAYAGYPVVGISHEQCTMFCNWLTDTYNKMPGRKFKKVKFDLPTEREWEEAAHGELNSSIFPWGGPYLRNAKGMYLANFLRIDEANIIRMDMNITAENGEIKKKEYLIAQPGDDMGVAGRLSDNADITAPSVSYWPNGYKLYNMAGNVEEYVQEKGISKGGSWRDPGYQLRIASREQYTDSTATSSERGFRVAMKVLE